MPKGYIYIRYSTAEQSQGDSRERQTKLAKQFVESRPDLKIELEDRIFLDSGVSSFRGGNWSPEKALGQFLAAVNAGEIDSGSVLLVESLDRLSRQAILPAQRTLLDLLNRNIKIVTTSEADQKIYDGQSGLVDLITMLVRMERAHEESALKSRRVRAAWEGKRDQARQNQIITRVCPQWLSVSEDGQYFIVDPLKAAVVRLIFECAEAMGYQAIARYLNEKGIPPFSDKSNGWQSAGIVKILNNTAVIGTYQPTTGQHIETEKGWVRRSAPDGPPIEGYYPAIVDKEVFYSIQTHKAARSTKAAGRKGPAVSNLFSHVARCGQCGSNMVLVQKGGSFGKDHYLVCTIARRGAGCKYHGWPYEPLERAFLSYCQNLDISQLMPEQHSDNELVSIKKRLAAAQGEQQAKRDMIATIMKDIESNGGSIPKAVQQTLLNAETQLEDLQVILEDLERELAQEQDRRRDQKEFGDMFRMLLEQMAEVEGADRFRLRTGLQNAIRVAVQGACPGFCVNGLQAGHCHLTRRHHESTQARGTRRAA